MLDYLEENVYVECEVLDEQTADEEGGCSEVGKREEGTEQALAEDAVAPGEESVQASAEVEIEKESIDGGMNEQETGEETNEENTEGGTGWFCDNDESETECEQAVETVISDDSDTEVAAEVESHESEAIIEQTAGQEVLSSTYTESAGIETVTQAQVVHEVTPLYTVSGQMLREDIQTYLYQRLCASGVGWLFETALMIAYQESAFDIYAQNPNGLDKGLFQYRLPYWPEFSAEAGRPGTDIFDPFAQIDVFVFQMARRAMSGCDVYNMVSRHNMSDFGPYNQVYVDQVMQHRVTLQRVR